MWNKVKYIVKFSRGSNILGYEETNNMEIESLEELVKTIEFYCNDVNWPNEDGEIVLGGGWKVKHVLQDMEMTNRKFSNLVKKVEQMKEGGS